MSVCVCYNNNMNLKLVYETAYRDKQPFDRQNKNVGEFIFSLMICDTLENMLEDSDEVTAIGLYLYLLKKSKKDLDWLEKQLF